MSSLLENYCRERGIDYTAENCQIRCLGHVINLAAQSLLSSLEFDNASLEIDILRDNRDYDRMPVIKKV
jgi:hypothetical protein